MPGNSLGTRKQFGPKVQEEQCGFGSNRCTSHQICTFHQTTEKSWEFTHPADMWFVDLEKAFDWIPRDKLWASLKT
ncbi:unnamed protein product [Soboliphyme baturini]|uniref:Reverse transcriptase domain-containing protein n=1 Tax=Soboliphyme baturini TaxID=241478 RepID=A0A183IIG1_9BILA|nr:unnamed protein product [Soboliphyme baturini]